MKGYSPFFFLLFPQGFGVGKGFCVLSVNHVHLNELEIGLRLEETQGSFHFQAYGSCFSSFIIDLVSCVVH